MRHKTLAWVVIALFALRCSEGDSSGNVGVGGSMSRFTIRHDYLYVVTNSRIATYQINGGNFRHVGDVAVSFGLETITWQGDYLYLGANDAMYIYSVQNPEAPSFVFRYGHIMGCDPVVVQGNRAYVTLRNGRACGSPVAINVLEIIDISNPNQPVPLFLHPMKFPGGLAIDGSCLFVCEGEYGLTWLDVSNDQVKEVRAVPNLHSYDVIARQGRMWVTGDDGIFQYTYSCDTNELTLVSSLPVHRTDF